METTYIEHHGIKGQKWGQRNGPPYPLKLSDHSSAEKKYGGIGRIIKRKRGNANDWSRSEVAPGSHPRDAKTMTNDELAAYNKRVALEKQYRKNTAVDSDKELEYQRQLVNAAKSVTDNTQRAADQLYREAITREKSNMDLSHVSDEELRKAVNRMSLERQYRDLKPVEIKTGEEKFKKAMDIIGPVISTSATVAAIALTIKQLRG